MEPKADKPKMTDLETVLLKNLRGLLTWVNDGCPGTNRDTVLDAAQKAVDAGEAKEL